jgi:hypothetical protein
MWARTRMTGFDPFLAGEAIAAMASAHQRKRA